MDKLTERYIQSLGFTPDRYDGYYKLECAENIRVNIAFLDFDYIFITLQVWKSTANISHIRTENQLEHLLSLLSSPKEVEL